MVAQDNIWRDMYRASRLIGALLTIVGGLVILFQGFLFDMLPPTDGYVRVDAEVMSLEQKGTFAEPAFSVTLAYTITLENGQPYDLRSGRRIDFEVYNILSEGATLTVDYHPRNPYEWRLARDLTTSKISDYALGLLMILFGGFSLIFPMIIRLASREDDFRYPEETQIEKEQGNLNNHYEKIAQR